MNISEYKTRTLAREDVKDIVKFEAVERDRAGNPVISLTESGRKVQKYDVHLMRVVDGVTVFDKEYIAVLDKGEVTEEVEFRSQSTEVKPRVSSKLEKYIQKLPYLDVEDVQIDPVAKNARFNALRDNKDGTATQVEVFAWIGRNPDKTTFETHVEITK